MPCYSACFFDESRVFPVKHFLLDVIENGKFPANYNTALLDWEQVVAFSMEGILKK